MENGKNGGPGWKWMGTVFLALIISLGGYIWSGMDRRSLAGESRLNQLEVDLAQEKIKGTVEYREIIRRLERIESAVERLQGNRFSTGRSSMRGFGE